MVMVLLLRIHRAVEPIDLAAVPVCAVFPRFGIPHRVTINREQRNDGEHSGSGQHHESEESCRWRREDTPQHHQTGRSEAAQEAHQDDEAQRPRVPSNEHACMRMSSPRSSTPGIRTCFTQRVEGTLRFTPLRMQGTSRWSSSCLRRERSLTSLTRSAGRRFWSPASEMSTCCMSNPLVEFLPRLLHRAGTLAVAQVLLVQGNADANAKTDDLNTPLHYLVPLLAIPIGVAFCSLSRSGNPCRWSNSRSTRKGLSTTK